MKSESILKFLCANKEYRDFELTFIDVPLAPSLQTIFHIGPHHIKGEGPWSKFSTELPNVIKRFCV